VPPATPDDSGEEELAQLRRAFIEQLGTHVVGGGAPEYTIAVASAWSNLDLELDRHDVAHAVATTRLALGSLAAASAATSGDDASTALTSLSGDLGNLTALVQLAGNPVVRRKKKAVPMTAQLQSLVAALKLPDDL
jgi:hypothetical protein